MFVWSDFFVLVNILLVKCLWLMTAHTDSVSLACAPAAQHKRRTSWAPCFSRTARPSRGSLPWAQTLKPTWPFTSTYSSYGSQVFLTLLSSLSPPFCSPLCLPCIIVERARTKQANRMSTFSSTPVCPNFISPPFFLLHVPLCLWMDCSFLRISFLFTILQCLCCYGNILPYCFAWCAVLCWFC